jgi:hypothetical protein
MPGLEDQDDAKNLNRGEKKCTKVLLKLGMKELTGITLVSLRKREKVSFWSSSIWLCNTLTAPEMLQSALSERQTTIWSLLL